MKNFLPRLKQFFSNKKVITVLLILVTATIIFEVKQIFFTKPQKETITEIPINQPADNGIPTPYMVTDPKIIMNTNDNFKVETNNEYIVSNPFDTYFDKSGNIFYVISVYDSEDKRDAEYKLFKYNLNSQKSEEIKDNNTSGKIHSIRINKNGIVMKNNDFIITEDGQKIYDYDLIDKKQKDTGMYQFFYQIENDKVNFLDKVDCKYHCGWLTGTDNFITTRDNNKILVTEVGENLSGSHIFYKKNSNGYIQFLRTNDGPGNDATGFTFFNYWPEKNSIILGLRDGYTPSTGADDIAVYISKLVLKDNDTLQEKEIYSFNPKENLTGSYLFDFNNKTYLGLIKNFKNLVMINLVNGEKLVDISIGNDFNWGASIIRNIDDKLLISTTTKTKENAKEGDYVDSYKCFNLSAKEFVSLDACGDPNKIYLGQWNSKNIYQINKIGEM